jgi:hypothetical protein
MEYALIKATQDWRHPIFGGEFTLSGPIFTHIPKLPPGIKKLALINTNIVSVKAEDLPEDLESLALYNNDMLVSILSLPSCLKQLVYMHGCLKDIPMVLPPGLTSLWLSGTHIVSLEDLVLPETLIQFSCGYSKQLTRLPKKLPPRLQYFNCNLTKLTFKDIPELPRSIIGCSCSDIQKHSWWYDRPPMYKEDEYIDNYYIRVLRFKRFIYTFPEAFEANRLLSRKRSVARCREIKEELMAVTWHPDRVLDWCDPNAFDFED